MITVNAEVHQMVAAQLQERIHALERAAELRFDRCAPLLTLEEQSRRVVQLDESTTRDRLGREELLQSRLAGVRLRGPADGWQPTGATPLPPPPLPLSAKQLRELGAVRRAERGGRRAVQLEMKRARPALWRQLRRSGALAAAREAERAGRGECALAEERERARLLAAMEQAARQHTIVCSTDAERWQRLVGERARDLLEELLESGGLEGASIEVDRIVELLHGGGRAKGLWTERTGKIALAVALKDGAADGVLVGSTYENASTYQAVKVGQELGVLTKGKEDRRDAYWPRELQNLAIRDRVRRLVFVAGVATRRGVERCRGLGQRLHDALWAQLPAAVTHAVLQPACSWDEAHMYEREREIDCEAVSVTNPDLVRLYQHRWGYRLLIQEEREREVRPPLVGDIDSADAVFAALQKDAAEDDDAAEDEVRAALDAVVEEAAEKARQVRGDTEAAMVLLGARPLPLFAGLQLRGGATA
eukprot:TRINITY_DN23020_c0_g2_i1.p1 TRINITY_DN23020_c0_g2~~TRINITY_DN23020_c0_g2_i1.p1  ORF type:complete len:477 (+),score=174.16 TRINITY_DN23020_c0_g2_i1:806-2236(+)